MAIALALFLILYLTDPVGSGPLPAAPSSHVPGAPGWPPRLPAAPGDYLRAQVALEVAAAVLVVAVLLLSPFSPALL